MIRSARPTLAEVSLADLSFPGEWNSYDIVCDGYSIQPTINGLLQNKGTGAKPSSGAICLQSEGSPI